ncbi:hypothetical protein EYF80_052465 [Liparis tanakae]|uniref:Uncharacterized protein n=1 Tax=Liparis tanakae TaxID=230148 RepID=A0A4Z2F981_9TELE|nr:hypothetical protein EYF80_052465 [Liparis tanakae]
MFSEAQKPPGALRTSANRAARKRADPAANYITGAVNRFFRPELTNIPGNDTNSAQETSVASEPASFSPAEGDASGGGGDGEQSLATVLQLSSSKAVVAWERCATDIDLGGDEDGMQYKTLLSGGSQRRASEKSEGMGEEQCSLVGNEDAGLLVVREDKREENGERECSAGGKDEAQDNGAREEHANTRSLKLTGDAISEDVEESGREAGAEEETTREVTAEDPQQIDNTRRNTQVKEAESEMQHEDEKDSQHEDVEVRSGPVTDLSVEEEEDVQVEDAKMQRNEADSTVTREEVEKRDGAAEPACQKENNSDEGAKPSENELPVCEEISDNDRDPDFTSVHVELQMPYEESASEDDSCVVEQEDDDDVEDAKEKGVVVEEENEDEDATKRTVDEAPEQEDAIEPVAGRSQEEGVAEEDDVQTKTREVDDGETESQSMAMNENTPDVTATHISADEGTSDQVEEERLFGEVGDEERVVALTPGGETGQEMLGGLKMIPPGICEGRVVVSQELNSPTCEETQEGVPEDNNAPGPDENTTQQFLVEGDCQEIQGSKLPEEVESKEPESLHSSGCGTGADYLLVTEQMEEDSVGAGLPRETEKTFVEAVTQESGHLFEEEEGELLVDSMKTCMKDSEKEFESDVRAKDDILKAAKELQDGSEDIVVEYEMDEGLRDSREADAAGCDGETTGASTAEETFLEAEGGKMTKRSFCQESVDAPSSEQTRNKTRSLLEDVPEHGFLKPYDEELLEDVEIQVSGFDVEETGCEEEEAAGDETQSKEEMEKLHLLLVESDVSRPVGSLETGNRPADEALERSDEMLTDSEDADESETDESKPRDLTLILVAKNAAESETATDGTKPQGSPAGQQPELSDEEDGETSSEEDEEQLVESNSRESESGSDEEISSSTVESGFSDQSLSEWGTKNSEAQMLVPTSTGSCQGKYDILAIVSESGDLPEASTQQDHSEVVERRQSYLKEEKSIAETGFRPDSGVPSPESRRLTRESNKQKVESVEAEPGSQKEIDDEASDWTDAEEADAKSLTEMSPSVKAEETEAEDEPLEKTESGGSRSGSEALFEDQMVLTESDSQGNTFPERKFPSVDEPQPGGSDDVASLLELNAADVGGRTTTQSEDQKEVDRSALDFTAQKSRISVKNPLVRPPKDPRTLLHLPSLDPSPPLSAKRPAETHEEETFICDWLESSNKREERRVPATPVTGGSVNSRFTFLQSSQLSSSTDVPSQRSRTASPAPDVKMDDLSESVFAPERWLDVRYFPEITLLDVTGDSSPMEVTLGGVLENNGPSLEPRGSHAVQMQTSAEETSDHRSPNVTQDIGSSSAASQLSTSDLQCNTSSSNVTLELHGDLLVTSSEANDKDSITEFTSKETRPSPETSGSSNNTLTSLRSSRLSSSISLNATAQMPRPRNTTLDLPPCDVNLPEAESTAPDPAASVSKNATDPNPNLSSDMQNATVDRRSLHKPSGETFSGDAGDAIVGLQNNTFDIKPPQYDTFISTEKSASDGCRNTFDASTPPVFCSSTSSPKEITSDAQHKGTLSSPDPNTEVVDIPESTCEGNPAVGQNETRDPSQSALPPVDRLSGALGHQNMDVENNNNNNNNANPFNLDDTLDLRADFLITSTPMATCNMLSVHMLEGKPTLGQRRLDGRGASKPDAQIPSDVPSNVASERKMFLRHQAVKSRLPTPRGASQLLRHKSASALPGRLEAVTSGLPVTRQRTQALRNPAAPNAPQTSGLPSAYKTRASTTDAAALVTPAAEISTPCTAVSRARSLKRPASSQRAPLGRAKGHDCANCVTLEHRLKILSEENGRLKEELLKGKKTNYALKKENK